MATHVPSRRWLSDIAAIFDALSSCPTVKRCVRLACAASAGKPDRSSYLERDLLRRLSSRGNTERLTKELCSLPMKLRDLPPVTGVFVRVVEGDRYPLDCWFVFSHRDGLETPIPVNVKTKDSRATRDRAVALGPLLHWLTEQGANLEKITQNLDADGMILGLIEGRTKILPGRDYWLMEVSAKESVARFRSLIARHKKTGTGLAVERHISRDVVNYVAAGGVVEEGFDIARELGLALLPVPSMSRLELQLFSVNRAAGDDPSLYLASKSHPG